MSQELDTINAIFQANYRKGSAYKHMPAFEDFDFDEVMKFMKLAYNQAMRDAADNAKVIGKCEYNKVHQENYFEYVVDKDSIPKLKIK